MGTQWGASFILCGITISYRDMFLEETIGIMYANVSTLQMRKLMPRQGEVTCRVHTELLVELVDQGFLTAG